ncbi:MAG: hypothetical protein PHN74_02050 [Candidatus Pacebacteria bacterium]|nr:hypothetical protein [Candidatus Paceibacterota bacterium]
MKKFILILIVAVVIIILGAGGYYYWNKMKTVSPESAVIDNAGDVAGQITDSATQGVLPELGNTNPLENKADVSPTAKTNPFSDIKTNPFK